MHGLHSCYEDANFTDYFLLCIVFIHSGMNEHLLYTRLYLVTGDAEVNWALSLVLICTKEAYQLVNLVLDPSLETNPPPPSVWLGTWDLDSVCIWLLDSE